MQFGIVIRIRLVLYNLEAIILGGALKNHLKLVTRWIWIGFTE